MTRSKEYKQKETPRRRSDGTDFSVMAWRLIVLIGAGSRIAQKFHIKRLDRAMRAQYHEAGMLSVTFCGHEGMDGVFLVGM
jgi:hypothetical protein